MSAFNRFGATASAAVALYPGSVANDFGGTTAVEEAIDRAVDQIVDRMPAGLASSLYEPWPVCLVRRGADGQTAATIPMGPVVAGSVLVWRGASDLFTRKPYRSDIPDPTNSDGLWPLDPSAYSVTGTAVTLATGLAKDEQVWAGWIVDQEDASYSIPSLARLAIRGAAADLGERVYSQASQTWALVERYAAAFAADLDRLAEGDMVPAEVRNLLLWEPVEPSGGGSASFGLLLRG